MARLPKAIIKKYGISKRAWEVFRGHRKVKPMARRYRRRRSPFRRRRSPRRSWFRRRRSKQLPLSIVLPAAYPTIEAALSPYVTGAIQRGDFVGAIKSFSNDFVGRYTGYYMYDGHFDSNSLVKTYTPIVVGLVVHKFLGKYINPYMRKIPMIGKYIGV